MEETRGSQLVVENDSALLSGDEAAERRRRQRRTRGDLPWLSTVKLPWGLEVNLVNISSTGMLIETSSKFAPGSITQFELSGQGTTLVVPARFVRSEVATTDAYGVKYHAAAVFNNEVSFPELQTSTGQSLGDALADVLTYVLSGAEGELQTGDVFRKRFGKRLGELLTASDVHITETPKKPRRDTESICFTVPTSDGSRVFLQVIFDHRRELGAVEFRFLQAAAALGALVLQCERIARASSGRLLAG
jgi:PilZ domain